MKVDYDRVKRLIDVGVAVPAFLLSLPFQSLVAGLIRLKMGRPVLFRQTRPGRHGEPFELVKFRTMTNSMGPDDLHATSRVTTLGRLLRTTSIDELPSLWNVIRGDMSLVGPRPLLIEYVDRYNAEQLRRHEVRPGITGLAQVSGRNATTWEKRLSLDVQYVDQRSWRLDLSIMARTVAAVLRCADVDAASDVTMSEFRGRESS